MIRADKSQWEQRKAGAKRFRSLTESKVEIHKKFQISFCKILRNKQYYVNILPKRVRLKGKTVGFRLQIQKLQRKNNFSTTRSTWETGNIGWSL